MRILFLALDIDLSKQRGDTVHAVELVRALCTLGHEITLVVGAEGSTPHPIRSIANLYLATGSTFRVTRSLRRILKNFPADIIYERRSTPRIGAIARMLWQIPYVLEVNGILREELAFQGRPMSSSLRQGLKDSVRRRLFKLVDRFVVVSPSIGEDLVRSYGLDPSRFHVIGNGVDTERFVPTEKMEACRLLDMRPDVPRIVFVGNLVGWRDFGVLLSALEQATARMGAIQLLIVGSGEELRRIERRSVSTFLPRTVVTTGEIPHERVPLYIAAADLCLLPERKRSVEISPLKLFEYLACARPVVASDVSGLELIEQLEVGRLVPPGDAAAMATAICTLLADDPLRREMGSKGREFVERDRSWRAVAARVSKVLAEAAAQT